MHAFWGSDVGRSPPQRVHRPTAGARSEARLSHLARSRDLSVSMREDPDLPLVFRRRDALRAGLTPDQVTHRLRTDSWHRLRRGVYCRADTWRTASPERRAVLLGMASVLLRTGNAPFALSHATAAAMHGLPILGRGHDVDDRLGRLRRRHPLRQDASAGGRLAADRARPASSRLARDDAAPHGRGLPPPPRRRGRGRHRGCSPQPGPRPTRRRSWMYSTGRSPGRWRPPPAPPWPSSTAGASRRWSHGRPSSCTAMASRLPSARPR